MDNIQTNCGVITPTTFPKRTMPPSLENSHIPYFHQMVCKWAFNIATNYEWVLFLDAKQNKNNILGRIYNLSGPYEPEGWEMGDTAALTWDKSAQETIGCIFAQGVRLPGEKVNVEYAGITETSRRGFLNGPIINGRTDFEALECDFLDTNLSFVESVLRPWSILVGHEGLIAREGNASLKCNIHVYQLAKNPNNRPAQYRGSDDEVYKNVIRKAWTFYDAVPISVSNEELKYDSIARSLRQASFVYNYYAIKSGAQGANI